MTIEHITSVDLGKMERFYRANLVNSISGYKPAMLIGTRNKLGQTNLAIFSSVVHLGADPALIGFIQRPVGVSGDTFRNIAETGVYTINHVHAEIAAQAHYTSAKMPEDMSEFDQCALTPHYVEDFAAPFVQEAMVKIGLELVDILPIRQNNTQLVIGQIKHLLIPASVLKADGNIDLKTAGSICISGLENYHQVQPLVSFPYAKLDNIPKFHTDKGPESPL